MTLFIGVDVGGTTSTIAIGDRDRNVLAISDQFPTRSSEGPDSTIEDILNQIELELTALGKKQSDVQAISLTTPGPATKEGVLMSTPNLDRNLWDQCPIRLRLEEAFAKRVRPVPVVYLGDGQAAAIGEYSIRTGHLHWSESPVGSEVDAFDAMFLVAVGTGLGGGEVRDRHPVQGSEGRAGHAGHLLLPMGAFRYDHDRQLKVGNAYCTSESAVSLTALTHQLGYRLTLDTWRDHPLNQQDGTIRDKAKQLRELASADDPLALELMDDQARALGITLLTIQYLGDYDRLVIGGGVCDMSARMRDRYLDGVCRAYHDHALDGFRNFTEISFAVAGDQASVLGSLYYAYPR